MEIPTHFNISGISVEVTGVRRHSCPPVLLMVLAVLVSTLWSEPVGRYPANPRYLAYQGRPLVLVASDHHYGAVIDLDFDFSKYLEYLADNGMNLTRIYPGGMFEPPDKYLKGNPLGPLPGRQILPWERSAEPGADPRLAEPGQPSFKFDLDRWNPAYFQRLKAFVEKARSLDIIVEVAFFNGMYADCWPLMALYHGNNVQGVGRYEAEDCGLFTTFDARNQDVLRYQKAYVAKITRELNEYDNLIYDLCDEPSLQGRPDGSIVTLSDDQVAPWLRALAEAFLETERSLPNRHILGQTVQNLSPDLSGEPWCDWLPTEYVHPAASAIEKNYRLGKPLIDVESDYFGFGLSGPYTAEDVRLEGWWFLLGGGAGFIHLNGEFHRGRETGGVTTRNTIVPQKRILRDFVDSLKLERMSRFSEFATDPAGAQAAAIADPGHQYAFYLFHAADDGKWGAHFVARPGKYTTRLTVSGVPKGRYRVEWRDPATGSVRESVVTWEGGDLPLTTPDYDLDIALRLIRVETH